MEASEDYPVSPGHLLLTAVIAWMFFWRTVEQEEIFSWAMVVHAFNPRTLEVEAGGSL